MEGLRRAGQTLHMAKASAPRKQYRRTFIREWRKLRGFKIEQLAAFAGMTASGLSYLERGQSGYSQDTLERIAGALNTTPATLIARPPNAAEKAEAGIVESEQARAAV